MDCGIGGNLEVNVQNGEIWGKNEIWVVPGQNTSCKLILVLFGGMSLETKKRRRGSSWPTS